ncbi:hypothetical protein MPSYJ_10980 [Mycolicibacterium psychrotolerans]|uniref:SDR family oxidoreductase n=1 Tax=Mycolicibacterium psychrotolerans TaxID=216929 RepID=A0A7I7M6X3_9MYCO|nr:hypothetical protein MPSYJ_10980 [Mycolicibacterium psychrotolerans]
MTAGGRHAVPSGIVAPAPRDDISTAPLQFGLNSIAWHCVGNGRRDVATDIAPVVCFLLGDDAAFVTGQTIMADGGTAGFR